MPTWTTTLPAVAKHHGFDLRRTPTSGALQAIVTCENLLVCDTHWWHGRTTPCERQANEQGKTIDDTMCQACTEKQAWRTHAYVSAFDAKTHEHFLFECTAFAAKSLAEYYQSAGTLRGCVFHASRPKNTPNGKVCIVTNTANLARVTLPNPPDVPRALSVIWRLPAAALPVLQQPHQPPTITTAPAVLKRMRQQLPNAADPPTLGEILAGNGHAKPAHAQ
jgi:hypothetical protein